MGEKMNKLIPINRVRINYKIDKRDALKTVAEAEALDTIYIHIDDIRHIYTLYEFINKPLTVVVTNNIKHYTFESPHSIKQRIDSVSTGTGGRHFWLVFGDDGDHEGDLEVTEFFFDRPSAEKEAKAIRELYELIEVVEVEKS
jgi:hypothetical protein